MILSCFSSLSISWAPLFALVFQRLNTEAQGSCFLLNLHLSVRLIIEPFIFNEMLIGVFDRQIIMQ